MIEKKFEKLELLKNAAVPKEPSNGEIKLETNGMPVVAKDESSLSKEQMQELFKETSLFSVGMLMEEGNTSVHNYFNNTDTDALLEDPEYFFSDEEL